MFESKEPRVKPVTRYRVPRYPSHADPDPTLHPTPVPYPATGKLLAAVAAMGVASSTSCSEPAPKYVVPAGGTVEVVKDLPAPTTENPFRVALAGLPHRTSPYGTGQPNYLDEKLARKAIEQVFAEAGYHLKPGVRYERNDVACMTSGYDAEKKIGYAWLEYVNLENDAVLRWWRPAVATTNGSSQEEIDAYLTEIRDDLTKTAVATEIDAAKLLPDPARREAAYRAILTRRDRDLVSLAEMKQLALGPAANHDFIAVISTYDKRFHQRHGEGFGTEDWDRLEQQSLQAQQQNDAKKLAELQLAAQELNSQKTLERLQQAVREYIAWARSQGAQ